MSLFSYQGKVWLAERNASGQPLNPVWVGNAPSLNVQMSVETSQKNESYSGNRLLIGQLPRAKTANISLTLDEDTLYNLALAFYGAQSAEAADTVTAEALPTGLAAGDIVRLDHPFVSTLVVDDSGGELVLDTDYRIESANAGLIEILEAPVDPVTADYAYAGRDILAMFGTPAPERWLLLDGINTADANSPVLVDIFRVQFNPVSDFGLITDEYGNITLTGVALYDTLNTGTGLGGFGRVVKQAAA